MFNLFLTAYGYDVFVAEDGETGLEMFKDISPDIVFTDIKMPGMDGLEVLRKIREEKTHTQVVIITGHGDMEKAVEALDLDASDFINKPVERQALNSALARAEKRKKLSFNIPFEMAAKIRDDRLKVSLDGKLSEKQAGLLKEVIHQKIHRGIRKIYLVINDGFSINRPGITALMSLIRELQMQSLVIIIENLSYNYVRVFQMAGMDKIATLVEEVLPE